MNDSWLAHRIILGGFTVYIFGGVFRTIPDGFSWQIVGFWMVPHRLRMSPSEFMALPKLNPGLWINTRPSKTVCFVWREQILSCAIPDSLKTEAVQMWTALQSTTVWCEFWDEVWTLWRWCNIYTTAHNGPSITIITTRNALSCM